MKKSELKQLIREVIKEETERVHIGTNTKNDSDIYFEPKTGSFYINVIDGAGNRFNKLKVNTIDDIIKNIKSFKWTNKGKELFPEVLNEMARTSINIRMGDKPYKVTDIKSAKTQTFVNQLIKIVRASSETGISRGELAKKLGKQQPQINSLINKMIEKGWLANVGGNISSPKQDKPSKTPSGKRFNGPEIEKKIKALASKGYIVTKQNSKDDGGWYYKIQNPKDVADPELKDRGIGIGYSAFSYKDPKPNTDYFFHNSHGGNDDKLGNVWNHSNSDNPGPGGWYTFDQQYIENKINNLALYPPKNEEIPKENPNSDSLDKNNNVELLKKEYEKLYQNEYPSKARSLGFKHKSYLGNDRYGELYFHSDWPREFRHEDEYPGVYEKHADTVNAVEEFESKVADLFDKYNVKYNAHAG